MGMAQLTKTAADFRSGETGVRGNMVSRRVLPEGDCYRDMRVQHFSDSGHGGFTIVEFLVVLVIMGILSTAGYPLLMDFAHQSRLEQEARVIFQDVCLARQAAITDGTGTGTVNFIRIPTESFVSSYEMFAPDGSNVRSMLMDEMLSTQRSWRRRLDTRAICILPLSVPASSTTHFTLHFDDRGQATNLPAAASSCTIRIQAFHDDTNPANRMPLPEVGGWEIIIDGPANTSAGPPRLVQLP